MYVSVIRKPGVGWDSFFCTTLIINRFSFHPIIESLLFVSYPSIIYELFTYARIWTYRHVKKYLYIYKYIYVAFLLYVLNRSVIKSKFQKTDYTNVQIFCQRQDGKRSEIFYLFCKPSKFENKKGCLLRRKDVINLGANGVVKYNNSLVKNFCLVFFLQFPRQLSIANTLYYV